MNSLFTVFMPRVAAELVKRGFTIVRTEPSQKNPNFKVYLFEDSVEFQLALQEIIKK